MNPTQSLPENYSCIPETSGNVVPGLDSLIAYIQSTYATLTALQNNIANVIHTIQTEINILEIRDQGDLNVNKEYYHNNYTDYTFQRNNTIHNYGNRITFIMQNHFFTYQPKGNHELQLNY